MRSTHLALSFSAALAFCGSATAFEIKGISPGDSIETVDLAACRAVENADSGIPGYRCDTTFGGAKAIMTLVVAEKKIVAIKMAVEGQVMGPIRDALAEKYGQPSKRNRYIEDYDWNSGEKHLSIKESRIARGYSVLSVDFSLFDAVTQQNKEKAKGDL